MKPGTFKRTSAWLPTVLVLLAVLLAGGRLVQLGLERNATEARTAARAALVRNRDAMEIQLEGLAKVATNEATRISGELEKNPSRDLRALSLSKNTLLFDMRGSVMRPASTEAALANGIASEWAAVDTAQASSKAGFMGPMRQGSLWIVATRVPVYAPSAADDGTPKQVGWAVAYADLDQIIANAKVGQLVSEGYSFTLLQRDQLTGQSRVFVTSSGTQPPPDPARINIRAPAPDAQTVRSTYFDLAIRPREGWVPISKLATDIGLLLLLAWLLAFGTHDLLLRSAHLKEALADSKRRLQSVNDKLIAEVEERQNLQKSFERAVASARASP